MTEKRFIVADYSTCVFDKVTKKEYFCIDREEAYDVCNLLNELLEDIEQLKKDIGYWGQTADIILKNLR